MRLLLDTHALIWWALDLPELSRVAYAAIADERSEVVVSAITAFEMATKVRIGKLPEAARLVDRFVAYCDAQGFEVLPVSADHALRAGRLPGVHRDPFDRMLVAVAHAEGVHLVTRDAVFGEYGVGVVW